MKFWGVAASLILLCASLFGEEYTLDVRNGAYERVNAVVSHTVTREWERTSATHALAEVTSGKPVPVPCGIDASGERPALVWLLSDKTAPGAVRRFAWIPKVGDRAFAGDLNVTSGASAIAISNSYFRLNQPVRGGGGFPRDITYVQSGHTDPQLYFLDRVVRFRDGKTAQYCAKECEDAETRVVFQSPLRVTVEARTGFGKRAADTPGQPRVVYRYTYTAFSPVVEVSARYTREDSDPWRELHFLHLSRNEQRYTAFVTGDPLKEHALQPKGAPSKAVGSSQWAVMADGDDACGVGFDGAVCWDASNEFVYYVRSACEAWAGRTHRLEGGIYFGPARGGAWYGQWLGRERQPEVRFFRDGKPWVPVERETLRGAFELTNQALRIVFDTATNGFDCLGIENRLADDVRFVLTREGAAGLWSLTFKTPPDATGKQEAVVLDNHSGGSVRLTSERVRNGADFVWSGLDLPGEAGVVDVRAEVRLEAGAGASAWRLKVTNRSKRFGLWSSDYPLLCGVAAPGVAEVLLPRGNWGGTLLPRHRSAYAGRYPSFGCPLQMLAFNLGEAGLYLAAHDGAARAKELVVTRAQDVTFRLLAENAGVPGAAGAPDYPVVIAAYKGDWWQAARRYRTWALQQSWTSRGPLRQRPDYPKQLQDVAFWMLLSGKPENVGRVMLEAEKRYAGVPIGVHWYGWHEIPFDNSYPEYFPTLAGMGEAARAMAQRGQTVMPYINARLWDRDIPSFSGAYPAACKQSSGTNYVEIYGSGRNLVPMCPYTRLWQDKVQAICHRLMDECGVNGIYLDQIGSAAPVVCYDASHGHPVGGGRHWVDGYHTMLRQVKAEAAGKGVALTTEDSSEPYMDVIDGCLAWNPRYQEDVPLLPAVYSGYTVYFTSPQAAHDTVDAFCAAQARDFLWGSQLGWNGAWILQEENREKQQFQYALCRYRQAAKDFFVYGQLLDEVRPLNDVPLVTHMWNRNQPHTARVPAVLATMWRDGRGRLAVFVVNTSGVLQPFAFDVDPCRWLKSRGLWRLSALTPEGETAIGLEKDQHAVLGDLRPREIKAFVFSPAR